MSRTPPVFSPNPSGTSSLSQLLLLGPTPRQQVIKAVIEVQGLEPQDAQHVQQWLETSTIDREMTCSSSSTLAQISMTYSTHRRSRVRGVHDYLYVIHLLLLLH